MDLTLLSGELWSWLPIAVLLTAAYFIYRALYRPINLRSVETYSNQSRNFKALRSKSFPPPYPNGWYRICNSVDIDGGRVKSVAALGTHFVAFRNSKREAGVLHAFCPHMGAHLGEGGVVKKDCLVCPFHEWAFKIDGTVEDIPYATQGVPERAKTRAYPVREHLGMIFIYFHEDQSVEPEWELDSLTDHPGGKSLLDGVQSGHFYYFTMRQMQFDQHVCEMHMNSADPHHFQTLHGESSTG
jgi:cholesterol 7-dehydrogenase